MKAFLKWIARIVGAALSLVLVVALLPYTTDLVNLILPDVSSAAERTAGELSHSLERSHRLETIRIADEGTVSNDFDIAGIYVGGLTFDYEYSASFGIDLSAVQMIVSGSRITFVLPEPELILDAITISNPQRRTFLVDIKDSDYENFREKERLLCRERYLTGDRSAQLWDATVQAFAETVEPWLNNVDSRLTFEYARSTAEKR